MPSYSIETVMSPSAVVWYFGTDRKYFFGISSMFGSLAAKYAKKPRQRDVWLSEFRFYLVVFAHISEFKRKKGVKCHDVVYLQVVYSHVQRDTQT
jgi:hypothetical protein